MSGEASVLLLLSTGTCVCHCHRREIFPVRQRTKYRRGYRKLAPLLVQAAIELVVEMVQLECWLLGLALVPIWLVAILHPRNSTDFYRCPCSNCHRSTVKRRPVHFRLFYKIRCTRLSNSNHCCPSPFKIKSKRLIIIVNNLINRFSFFYYLCWWGGRDESQ